MKAAGELKVPMILDAKGKPCQSRVRSESHTSASVRTYPDQSVEFSIPLLLRSEILEVRTPLSTPATWTDFSYSL